jgi:hypothetical protein
MLNAYWLPRASARIENGMRNAVYSNALRSDVNIHMAGSDFSNGNRPYAVLMGGSHQATESSPGVASPLEKHLRDSEKPKSNRPSNSGNALRTELKLENVPNSSPSTSSTHAKPVAIESTPGAVELAAALDMAIAFDSTDRVGEEDNSGRFLQSKEETLTSDVLAGPSRILELGTLLFYALFAGIVYSTCRPRTLRRTRRSSSFTGRNNHNPLVRLSSFHHEH